MARHPLAGIHLKLGRAREHFKTLKAEMEPFVLDAYPLERRFDEETGWRTYHVRVKKEPPERFGLLAGEITALLRSSLDILVYQLALIGQGDPGRTRTQFPIFTDHVEYTKKDGRGRNHRIRMLKNVSETHRAIIDGYQPYQRVSPDRDPLALLKAFRDAYEHRDVEPGVIMVHRPGADFEALKPGTVRDADFRQAPLRTPLTDGTEILGFRLRPDPKAEVKVDIKVRFDIGFEPAHTTLIDLDRIRRHVEKIIRRFEPDFP